MLSAELLFWGRRTTSPPQKVRENRIGFFPCRAAAPRSLTTVSVSKQRNSEGCVLLHSDDPTNRCSNPAHVTCLFTTRRESCWETPERVLDRIFLRDQQRAKPNETQTKLRWHLAKEHKRKWRSNDKQWPTIQSLLIFTIKRHHFIIIMTNTSEEENCLQRLL